MDNVELYGGNDIVLYNHLNVLNNLTITSVNNLNGNPAGLRIKVGGNVVNNDANGYSNHFQWQPVFVSLMAGVDQNLSGTGVFTYLDLSKTGGNAVMLNDIVVIGFLTGTATGHFVGSGGILRLNAASVNFTGDVDNVELYGGNDIVLYNHLNVLNNLTITSVNNLNGNPGGLRIKVGGNVVNNDASGYSNHFQWQPVYVSLTAGVDQNLSGTGVFTYLDLSKTGGNAVMLNNIVLIGSLTGTATGHFVGSGGILRLNSTSVNFAGDVDNVELYGGGDITLYQNLNVLNNLTITAVNNLNGNPGGLKIKVGGNVVNNDASGYSNHFQWQPVYVSLTAGVDQNLSGTGVFTYLDLSKTGGNAVMLNNIVLIGSLTGTATGHFVGSGGILRLNSTSVNFAGDVDNVELYGGGDITLYQNLNVLNNLTITAVNNLNGNPGGLKIKVGGNVVNNDASGYSNHFQWQPIFVSLIGAPVQTVSGAGYMTYFDVSKPSGTTLLGAFTGSFGPITVAGAANAAGIDLEGTTKTAASITMSGGKLIGSGTWNSPITCNSGSTIAPGASPGCLTINGNLALNSGSTFAVDVNGNTPCTDFDQLTVNGTVTINNATFTGTGATPATGIITLIANDLTDAIAGSRFASLPQNATVNIGGFNYKVSYTGGTGNDLTLTGNTPPTAVCQNVTVNANSACQATVSASAFNNGSSDPEGDGITYSVSPAAPYAGGTTTVTLSATDSNNATSTCTATVTVVDITPPTITCPAAAMANTDAGLCTASGVSLGAPTTADNCGVQSTTNNAPTAFASGNTTITWTVTDTQGLSATCAQTVTVTDNQNPTITCPTAATANTDAGLCTASGVNLGAPTTSDNCGVQSATANAPANFAVGSTTVTWTATDAQGLTATCAQTVTVTDNQNPTISCPATALANTDANLCTASGANLGTPTTADNCGVQGTSNNAPTTYALGNSTVIWTVTDVHGRSATCAQTVTVKDAQPPTVTSTAGDGFANVKNYSCNAAPIVFNADVNACTALRSVAKPTWADNCTATPATSFSTDNGTPVIETATFVYAQFPKGTTVVSFTATDAANPANTATCDVTIQVNDTQLPILAGCQSSNVSVNVTPGSCSAPATWMPPTPSDNCTNYVLTRTVYSPANQTTTVYGGFSDPGSIFPAGTYTVHYKVTDAGGLTATCTFNLTVVDNEAPVFNCASLPATVALVTDQASCTNGTDATPPGMAVDNCSGNIAAVGSRSDLAALNDLWPVGSTTLTWTFTDASNNTKVCSQTVTVTDNQNPTITCPAVTSINTSEGLCTASSADLGTPTTADNCGVQSVTNNAAATIAVGASTVTWTVTDTHGLTATCAQTVTVVDNENPTITCPAIATANTDANLCTASSVSLGTPTTGDNCGVQGTTNNAPTTYAKGNNTVTWTVTDVNGRTATCAQTVTVTDGQAPVITCPANATIGVGTSAEGPVSPSSVSMDAFNFTNDLSVHYPVGELSFWPVNGTVNVSVNGGPFRAYQITSSSGGNANLTPVSTPVAYAAGTRKIANTYAGLMYNVGSCSSGGYYLNFCPTGSTALNPTGTATATDNCTPAATVSYTDVNNLTGCNSTGTITRTWVATDGANNTSSCVQNITVSDQVAPVITCPSPVAVNTTTGQCTGTATFAATATDDSGNAPALSYSPASGSTFAYGATVVTATATDACGNSKTCSFTVTVTDNENPTITCPATATASTDAGLCTASGVSLGTPTTADNCGVQGTTNNAPTTYAKGNTTVTWTVTDIHGRTATCAQTVTVTDNQNPTISCPVAVTANTSTGLCTASGVSLGTPTTSDNCGVQGTTNNAPTTYDKGNTTVTWTVTDVSGLTATCTQTVTVTDNQAPTITCPTTVAVNTATGSCSNTASWTAPSGTDNCTGTTTSGSHAPGASFNKGTTTVTYTATDAGGLTATCTFNVVVTDNENPTITCPATATANADAGQCTASNVTLGTPTTADNCGVQGTTNNAPTSYAKGNTTVTWTVTDVSGRTATCAQTVTVTDNAPPVITCAGAVSINTTAGLCTGTTTLTAPTVTDNCPVNSTTGNALDFDGANDKVTAPNTGLPVGNSNRTVEFWVKTFGNNMVNAVTYGTGSNNAQFSCSIYPQNGGLMRPTLWCQFNDVNATTLSVSANTWTHVAYVYDGTNLTFYVNGVAESVPFSGLNTGSVLPLTLGAYVDNAHFQMDEVRIWNTARTQAQIQQNMNTELSGSESGLVSYYKFNQGSANNNNAGLTTATATTGSNGTLVNFDLNNTTSNWVSGTVASSNPVVTNDAPATYPKGSTTVTWTTTDGGGNTATCSQIVTVTDNQAPTITCPATATANTDAGLCAASVVTLGTPTTGDNCGVQGTTNNAPTTYAIGNNTVTWTVTDVSGLTATCAQTVTITDNQPPTISCLANFSVNNDLGQCNAVVVFTAPAGTDNCSNASTAQTGGLASGAAFPVGITTNTFTVTAANGQTASCTFTVTVTDAENPTITCPATATANTDAGLCTASGVALGTPTTSDNCGVQGSSHDAPTAFASGNTTVTWTVTDLNGRTATCTQTVTVTDNQPPTITCPTAVTANTDANQCTASSASLGTPTTGDNCGVQGTTNDAPTTYTAGANTVTWTVTDVNGLTATCAQTVTITDAQNPSIVCPQNIVQNTDAGLCSAVVTFAAPTASDNCGNPTVTQTDGPASGAQFPSGTTMVNWKATDSSGNSAICGFSVTVNDNQNPTITCPATVSVGTAAGLCTASGVSLGTPTTDDNCGVQSTSNNAPTTFTSGNTTVIWTVTDVNSRTATCSQTVTVTDSQNPTITCPATVSVNTTTGLCAASGVTLGTPTTSDNCGVQGTTNNAPTTYPKGNNSVTWTVTDVSGLTATCAQTVTVTDNQNPTITCPAAVSVGTTAGQCTASGVSLGTPTTSDNCGVQSVTNNAPANIAKGTITVTWTVTDVSGLTATCTQSVTVTDNEAPTIACAPSVTINATTGICTGTTPLTPPTAADNCSLSAGLGNALSFDGSSDFVQLNGTFGGPTWQEATIEAWVNSDATGGFQSIVSANSLSFVHFQMYSSGGNAVYANNTSFNLPIIPQTPGVWKHVAIVVKSGNSKVYVNGVQLGGTATTTFDYLLESNAVSIGRGYLNSRLMNGKIDEVRIWTTARTQAQIQANMNNQLVGNEAGLYAYYNFNQGVAGGNNAGVTNLPSLAGTGLDGTLNTFTLNGPTSNWVGSAISNGLTNNAPATYAKGATTVTWTAIDAVGNTKTCAQVVTVVDNQPPSITCPATQAVNLNVSCQASLANYTSLSTVSDNCTAAASITRTQSPAAGTAVNGTGTTVVTLTATDGAGLTKTCVFNVTRNDVIVPTITCPAAQSLELGTGCAATLPNYSSLATATDNCTASGSIVKTQVSPAAGSTVSLVGAITVTLRATDASGRSKTCTFTVNKVDNTAPFCGAAPQGYAGGNDQVHALDNQIVEERIEAQVGQEQPFELEMFPNPTDGLVHLVLHGLKSMAEVTVFDPMGRRVVWQQKVDPALSTLTLNMAEKGFAEGLYFVTVRSEGATVTRRLVVAR